MYTYSQLKAAIRSIIPGYGHAWDNGVYLNLPSCTKDAGVELFLHPHKGTDLARMIIHEALTDLHVNDPYVFKFAPEPDNANLAACQLLDVPC